jgi:hypothetical protein
VSKGTISAPYYARFNQGNDFKAPFGELVVTGSRQTAARADCGRTVPGAHGNFDTLLVGTEAGVLVDKKFHGAEAGGGESLP